MENQFVTEVEKNVSGKLPGKRRILLVEDDETLLASFTRQLTRAGYEVQGAFDGLDALGLLNTASFDMVITDVLMPRADGFEMIQEIRKRWPSLKIIAMSGGGYCGAGVYLEICMRFGAVHVLEKPFAFETLLEVLRAKFQEATEALVPAA